MPDNVDVNIDAIKCRAGIPADSNDPFRSDHVDKRCKKRPHGLALGSAMTAIGERVSLLVGVEREYVPEHHEFADPGKHIPNHTCSAFGHFRTARRSLELNATHEHTCVPEMRFIS